MTRWQLIWLWTFGHSLFSSNCNIRSKDKRQPHSRWRWVEEEGLWGQKIGDPSLQQCCTLYLASWAGHLRLSPALQMPLSQLCAPGGKTMHFRSTVDNLTDSKFEGVVMDFTLTKSVCSYHTYLSPFLWLYTKWCHHIIWVIPTKYK